MKQGRLIIISAPSGTGKTSVIQRFLVKHPNMIHSVSCTTRPQRITETNGKDYHFIDAATFQKWIQEGKLAEWADVHNYRYGTPKEPLDEALSIGKNVLLDLDVVGGMNLKKMYQDRAVSVFLIPPDIEELKRRLFQRGTDSPEQQEIRLKNAMKEMTVKNQYDYQVVNDILDRACGEIEKILGIYADA